MQTELQQPETVQQQVMMPAPVPEKKKKKGPGFVTGLIVGCALAAIAGVFLFAFVYPRLYGYNNHTNNLLTTHEKTETPTDGPVLDEATSEKLDLINDMILDHYYKDDVGIDEKREALYRGLVASLGDAYSVYYDEEEFISLQQQNEGIYYGIGAYVSFDEDINRSYVSGVIKGSPALEAGLKENDIFWEVDGTSTEGMPTDEVASLIRGPENTDVTIVIHRGSEELTLTITRRKVEHQTVDGRMLEDGIGYIQLAEFDSVTPDQFIETYEELQAEGMRAMVLDLRGNPGGNLDAVCKIADRLLPKGIIVYTIDKYDQKETYEADGKHEIRIPLAVLVNGNSASAAEILAGAIKDYNKGTLIGTTTFGKGIVQRYFPLGDGTAIKLTISDYYTPSGNNIHKVGIEPDKIVEFDAEAYEKDETDNQLDEAVAVLKKELD